MTLHPQSGYAGCWRVGVLICLILIAIGSLSLAMRPSSPPKWAVMTDANGCQYLFSYVGGVTPRLTVDGKHMGCWENPDNHPKDKVGPRNQQ